MHGKLHLVSGGRETVDKDRVKGTVSEITGRTKRQVGEWTDNTEVQIEGLLQEVKGNAQKTWGGVKDPVRGARESRKDQDKSNAAGRRSLELVT
jgi:uncharacterized protein YjbJ (UPF0337 family)